MHPEDKSGAPLFHRLILINRDQDNFASFSINGSSITNLLSNGAGQNAYLFDGSVVALCDKSGTTQTRYTLTRDISFVFEAGSWRGQITGAVNNSLADSFSDTAASFLQSSWSSANGGNQSGALTAMYDFMLDYTAWANQCPHFTWHGANSAFQVPEYTLLNALGTNFYTFTGTNGLLR